MKQHMGDLKEATNTMNIARNIDLQDRFINSKCTKYMLRSGNTEEAVQTIGLFTKVNPSESNISKQSVYPVKDLLEMQCSWFFYESGMAYYRAGQIGLALKNFHNITKVSTYS